MRKTALFAMLFMLAAMVTAAQDAAPVFTNTEYEIGFDCPVAHELSADGAALWVLMRGCFSRAYTLQAFSIADGTRIDMPTDYAAELQALVGHEIIPFTNPMAFTPDGDFSIFYSDAETYAPRMLVIAADGGILDSPLRDEALFDALIPYTEYPEYSIFSPDHTQAAAVGTDGVYVVDLATGESVFSLPLEAESYNAFPAFSPDSGTLYVARLDDIEDFENNNATVYAYSLPDGELINTFAAPSQILWFSPDGRYAAANIGSNDGTSSTLYLADLTTGGISEPFALYEPQRPLSTCANDGRDMSDVDFTVSGRLAMYEVDWLPDSTGIVFTRDYRGEAAGGGRPCAFNTSRLNRIDIASE